MYRKFWGGFATYMGKNEKNKTRVKFPRGKKTYLKKSVIIRKVARTDTSNKDVSQILSINYSDKFWKYLDKKKELSTKSKS